jgi:hypothetical protein
VGGGAHAGTDSARRARRRGRAWSSARPSSERGGMAPGARTAQHRSPAVSYIWPPPPPCHTGLENLASARATAIAHAAPPPRHRTVVEPGCGNETNPSTMVSDLEHLPFSISID